MGWGPVVSHIAGAQQGLKGGGFRAWVMHSQGAWILVIVELAWICGMVWQRGCYLTAVWVWLRAGIWHG
jgi:hypothetical protein